MSECSGRAMSIECKPESGCARTSDSILPVGGLRLWRLCDWAEAGWLTRWRLVSCGHCKAQAARLAARVGADSRQILGCERTAGLPFQPANGQ